MQTVPGTRPDHVDYETVRLSRDAGSTGPGDRPGTADQGPPDRQPPGARGSRRESRGGSSNVLTAVIAALVSALITIPLSLGLVDSELARNATAAEEATTAEAAEQQQEAESDTDTEPVAEIRNEGMSGVAAVASAVSPSVAYVEVGQGSGSAVVFRDGYLLTNAHVVGTADTVEVTLPDSTSATAEVVGTDPTSDLAVIEIADASLPAPEYAEELPAVGETAIAIGSPFGLEGSVTSGVVSALNRTIPAGSAAGGQNILIDLIQTDAPLNPGNSGGALVDIEGRIIGINTAILGRTNAGIGFAIPTTSAVPIAEELIADGVVSPAFLGIQGETVDPSVADMYGLGADAGAVVVAVVDGSPADDAGLQRGDIITGIDGDEVASMPELAGRIRRYSPEDSVTLTIVRDAQERELSVTLTEPPAQPQQ